MEQASEPIQEAVVKSLLGARDDMLGIRYHMRQMGEAAGVPVGYSLFDTLLVFLFYLSVVMHFQFFLFFF